ncbi:hypothetical protein [Clostridium sp.]|uniref:hypothetical protein n=1 Tax=Clostridium sp. TaxID=1506 RepID=UPI0032164DB6
MMDDYDCAEESFHCPNAYNQLGISTKLIDNIELSIKCYKKLIQLAKYQRNKNIIFKSLDQLLTILIEENNLEEINSLKNEVLELISLDIIDPSITPVLKLMKFYSDIGSQENLSSLLNFILECKKG